MAMKILVLGKNGQVGFELQRSMAVLGDVVAVARDRCDLAQPDSVRSVLRAERPDVILNAAAYTAVDKAEQETDLANLVNGKAAGVLAEEAEAADALLVHYSTDYVFDGTKAGAYREDDEVAPQSAYGLSKLAGEQAIRQVCAKHVILRTSWVFGAHGANFLKTALRLARQRDAVKIVADQFGAPTGAALIADVTAHIVARYGREKAGNAEHSPFPYGTYHLAASGETTWHGYAVLVAQLAKRAGVNLRVEPDDIQPIATSEYPLPAHRPANSRLNTVKLREAFGLTLPAWQTSVTQAMQLITEQIKAEG